jgi:LysR family hydrogen peroxide-inducible transcriptional activator
MTLTELKYIVAVARAKHFGHAAESCFVAQPTLSVAIKKLEDELGVTLFERGGSEVSVTPVGAQIVAQAERVLEQTAAIKELAKQNKDPLAGPLRLGVIYTIGPYLLPPLVKNLIDKVPQMPLVLQENFTVKLLELLRQGELDAAIMALPLPDHGMLMQTLYDEPFVVATPRAHPWSRRREIPADDLKAETMLLLGSGHCFRDQVLEVCPEMARFSSPGNGMQRTFEGSSLETIRHMVASGIGLTVLPRASVRDMEDPNGMLAFVPFSKPTPSRRVVIVWRKSFTRRAAIEAVCNAVAQCDLPGVYMLAREKAALLFVSYRVGRRVGGCAAHAVIVGCKIIVRDIGADNDHRVGGEPAHPTRSGKIAILYTIILARQEANHEQAGALFPPGPR